MTFKELNEKILAEAFTMRKNASNTANPWPHYERMKNILINNLDDIEKAVSFAAGAEVQIAQLDVMLSDAEDEITELKKQLEEKTTQDPKPAGKKGKPKDE